jgi:uncharacterized membrane protein YkvA (DUF1232 family)
MGLWSRLIEDFRLLYGLIKDYWKGKYRKVSIWSIIVFFLAIAYILCPIDILSDFVPLIGQIDDAVILFVCMFLLEKDLYRYREWKMAHSS